ncbi:MAG TPA: phospho-N-acetylmuramoyl-pentapeptide-transferase [Syntrophomonadaceae bacterium]|jgi:phospho-N-acetylmuramoyl-pentapeptide-transferase|nr:phospho-N-acetylmuramoyl-pentapeptide-transferase [Syntrophomonadaceae bacterium]HOQ08732.1 phospho-N-acetylmuramoyl-pentapeptide-transferase [Syntrophomonadaceae bacterium]HPU47848.1 phospho-N-acetylmuramoyl-pentapeptide-transferase [Syntrophomonadaceae bacterium]
MQGIVTTTLLALLIAGLITLLMGPVLIPFLTRLKVGQNIREDGPQRHLKKAGTPTMGGIMIVTAVMAATFIMAGNSGEAIAAVVIMLAFGAVGFWDDYIKVVLKRSLGLRAREKLGLQLLIGLAFALLLLYYFQRGTYVVVPFSGYEWDLGLAYIPFLILVLMATTNTVNLTDGLDGLASGVTFFVALAFALVCLMTSHYQLTVFCGALAGGCLGFLFFNRHPARVFMGDTGSMALGGAVAAVAAFTHSELFLLLLGGVYVLEGLSVILQVISFQTTGRRILLMAPLHHHFELKGWPEKKVVRFFWFLALLFTVIGLLGYRNIG